MADDKNINNPEEPANDNNEQQQPNNNDAEKGKPAADYAAYRKASKEFRQARQKQEDLEKHIEKYKQEAQEKQDKHEPLTMGDIEALKLDYDIETGALLVNGEKQPQLDPDSPQFDPALYNEYAAAVNEKLNETMAQVGEVVRGYASDIMNTEEMQAMLKTISETVAPALDSFKNIVASIFDSEALRGVKESLRYITEHSEELKQSLQEWEALQPYLEEELKKPEYGGKTLDELLEHDYKDENGNILNDSLLEKAVEAARAAMIKQMPVVYVNSKIASVDYPLDKINSTVWQALQQADKDGQISMLPFAMEKRGSKVELTAYYSIDFAALEEEAGVTITKHLTKFDKRVYIAAGALFNNGFKTFTVAQIYTAMGNAGRPNSTTAKKINDSLTKMQAAHIYLDNTSESKYYKYDKFVYDASLLPMERVNAVMNGQEVTAVRLFREPPLITFARERKQITTISRKLLESPLSKTEANLTIEDYLLERISHMKNKGKKSKISNKMLYDTIYKECNITSRMERSRAPEKIHRLLEFYKEKEFIKDYKAEADGITITF